MDHCASIEALERLIDSYCEAWGTADPAQRERALNDACVAHATYFDPRARTTGIVELSAYIDRVLSGRPGTRFVRTSGVDVHHGLARFGWRAMQPDGSVLTEGVDFIELSGDGRLLRIVGFSGPLASRYFAAGPRALPWTRRRVAERRR